MSTQNTTIPKQHYVTIQYRSDASTESGLLGFASPYTKDAAFLKRKSTQDSWAYHNCAKVIIDPTDDSITCEQIGEVNGVYHSVDVSTMFITKCFPIITNNDPIEGFEVAKSVKRCGWNGGNVVWRIADPRGFELEISSANFARVLDCTTVINGVIQGKCVWGRNGKDNILLPEASDVYQAAVVMTEKVAKKVSLKDVKVGDTVELLLKHNDATDQIFQYLGKYYFLTAEQDTDSTDRYGYGTGTYRFNKKQTERYLLKSVKTGKYITPSTPKITSIVNAIAAPLDKMEIAKEATASIGRDSTAIGDISRVLIVSPTKFDMATVTTELVPFTETIAEWPIVDSYYPEAIISFYDNKYYIASSKGSYYSSPKKPLLQEVSIDKINENVFTFESHMKSSSYWGGSRYTREYIYRDDFKFEDLTMYKIKVTANGITGTVNHLG